MRTSLRVEKMLFWLRFICVSSCFFSRQSGVGDRCIEATAHGIGVKKIPIPSANRALNWYLIHPKCAVADAVLHRRPYFTGVLRARATSQPLATLRAILTLPILFFMIFCGLCHKTLTSYTIFLGIAISFTKISKKLKECYKLLLVTLLYHYALAVRERPMAFIRLITISPILAISSVEKAWRKLSENKICALGGNSSSPTHSKNCMVRPGISVTS